MASRHTVVVQHTLSELASQIDGELRGPDATFDGASIDSRTIAEGALFVPIVAERDGHDFIETAVAGGAVAHLTSEPNRVFGSALLVADTATALSALGSISRDRLAVNDSGRSDVIGVTGSVGKTSVKDLIAATIGADRLTHANPASFNNELGLPLTLVNTPDGAETVVLEMGARGVGHIASLCAIGRPTVGVVTRVAEAHTELFGSLEGVAQAKGELIEAIPADGVAILNADDPYVAAMRGRASATVLTYGSESAADGAVDVRVADLELDDELRPRFTINTPNGSRSVRLNVSGAHMASNAAAAITAALAVGVDLDVAIAGIGGARLSALRMDVTTAASGATVINDAYNANPTSMRAALAALTTLDVQRRIAVLGVMAELGTDGDSDHRAIAAEAGEAGIRVIAVDAPAYGAAVEHVDSVDAALAALGDVGSGDAVLVKGSRVAQLERLVPRLS